MSLLICPVRHCGQPLSPETGGVTCRQGHRFDRARSGYLNLLQPQDKRSRAPGDSKQAVAARRRSLDRGLGQALLDSLQGLLKDVTFRPSGALLDIGCGEGYYGAHLAEALSMQGWGVDISSAALEAAAKRYPMGHWIVANADRSLPFADKSVDLLLSVTSRKNGLEYSRIIHPSGLFIVVIPDLDDLAELREAVLGQALEKDRKERTLELLGPFFELQSETHCKATFELDSESLADLLTGSYRGARFQAQQRFAEVSSLSVTLSYCILAFRPNLETY